MRLLQSAVLGHANISTTSRYLKASRAGLASYVERFEQHRRQQAAAQKKAASTKSRRSCTPFAHDAAEGRASAPDARGKTALSL